MANLLTFCDHEARSRFPLKPFSTRHALSDHPLLQLPALADLAKKMDPARIEYSSGEMKPDQLPENVRPVDLSPEQVIEQIEGCGAWLVIKNVECMPQYRKLLEDILKSGAKEAGYESLESAGMVDIRGYIFVASAGSVTPFHADDEENLFVHLHGHKLFHVFDNEDRSLVSEADLESFPGKHRNLKYRPEFENRAIVYDLHAGDGIFLPYNWPHWVKTLDDYAISMQVTWRSPRVARLNNLMVANALLRAAGFPQSAPDTNRAWDSLKAGSYSLARASLEPLRRSDRIKGWIRGLFFNRQKKLYYGSNS